MEDKEKLDVDIEIGDELGKIFIAIHSDDSVNLLVLLCLITYLKCLN